jgi:hypothetical protein
VRRHTTTTRHTRGLSALLVATVVLRVGAAGADARMKRKAAEFDIARAFFEYDSTANDLGVHVFLDGEDCGSSRSSVPGGARSSR